MPVETIRWTDGKIRIIDQTLLPGKRVFLEITELPVLEEAIRKLRVRGAPAIGIAGAMGVALAAYRFGGSDHDRFFEEIRKAISGLSRTRPTAVNLFWALKRMEEVLDAVKAEPVSAIKERLIAEAVTIWEEDREICRRMGRYGAGLLPDEGAVLTHCNAGGLATADYGTALGVIYAAVENGKKIKVYADETRPLLQGARLTAWELKESGVDVIVLCDSAAGFLMQSRKIDCVLVGADRIAANGDTANKVGTYSLAVLAREHRVPFYVVAPLSTFDFSLATGDDIPIEERSGDEVVNGFGIQTGPDGVIVYNPAFDVTFHSLVTAFITEEGVMHPPFSESLGQLQKKRERA